LPEAGFRAGESVDPPSPEALARYRPNVGVVLINRDGKLWLGRRSDASGPRNWQFPQGGVDKGEQLLAAALRELHEETGARSASLIGRTSEWMAYAFPSAYRRGREMERWIGQKQIWFALRFTGQDSEFDLSAHETPEFDAWRWVDVDDVLPCVVEFKQATYERVLEVFRPLITRVSGAD
jgi:putative (di)nucleoside polyphosphate hydrolase